MRIKFLRQARIDLRWFEEYYLRVFPDGRRHAKQHYLKTLMVLGANPLIGHSIADGQLREYAIPRIPFSLIYRLRNDEIEILRIWDQRALRPESWTTN